MKYGDLTWGQTEALVNKIGGKEVADGILSGELAVTVTKVAARILGKLSTIVLSATGKFIASDHFSTDSKEVKISWLGDNFQREFLAKVEEPQAGIELCYAKLKKASIDAPILAELGDRAEITLASIWELLKKQPKGESGKLLTNGYANIFYVRDAKRVFWVVDVYWYCGGWGVDADSVEDPGEWHAGGPVFSRNS